MTYPYKLDGFYLMIDALSMIFTPTDTNTHTELNIFKVSDLIYIHTHTHTRPRNLKSKPVMLENNNLP